MAQRPPTIEVLEKQIQDHPNYQVKTAKESEAYLNTHPELDYILRPSSLKTPENVLYVFSAKKSDKMIHQLLKISEAGYTRFYTENPDAIHKPYLSLEAFIQVLQLGFGLRVKEKLNIPKMQDAVPPPGAAPISSHAQRELKRERDEFPEGPDLEEQSVDKPVGPQKEEAIGPSRVPPPPPPKKPASPK